MTSRLAKLSNVKQRLGATSTDSDAALLQALLVASELAERLAGLEPGGLRYNGAIVEYPWEPERTSLLYLGVRPLWSVEDVRVLSSAGDDAAFEAATPLTLPDDFVVGDRGTSELVSARWWPTGRSCVRVRYAAGYVDPARVSLGLTTATYTAATRTLTQEGAFGSYTYKPGDVVQITGGTDVTLGAYLIASKTSSDAIVLAADQDLPASVDLTAGDISDLMLQSAQAMMPGSELQAAVEQQAIRLWQGRAISGARPVNFGQGSSAEVADAKPVDALVDWAQRFKRRFF